jgi:AGZA family xanthine/uracil permease-like MFS transporter
MLIGIVATALVGWLTGQVSLNPEPYSLASLTGTAFQLDLAGVFGLSASHGLGLLEILFVFLFVDLFDNIGTLVAVTKRAGLMDADGRIPRLNRILFTDATATIVGSMAGTSTVTSYVESAAGVQAGGRTGLTAVVTGVLFLATMFVAPYAQLIPLAATGPALVIVGGLMLLPLTEVEWDDPLSAIPAFLTVAMIPLTFSIANGLAFGITAHAALKLVRGTIVKSDWFLLLLAVLFVFRFAWMGGA